MTIRTDTSTRSALLWAVACGGLVMGASVGFRHVQGLFLLPMTLERGWSRETFAFALAVQNLCWGLAQPFTGAIADRFGSRRVLLAGLLLYAAGVLLMGRAGTPLQFHLAAGLLIGLAQSCTAFGMVYGALSRIAPAPERGWVLGLTGAVAGTFQFVGVPLTQALLATIGWQQALMVLAGLLLLALPAVRGLDDRAALQPAAVPGAAVEPAASLREVVAIALRHRGFLLLNLGFLSCGFHLAFIATHLPAYLLDQGVAPRVAVTGLAVIALANIAGTYCCGHLGALVRRRYLLSGLYLVRTAAIGLFVATPPTPATVYAFCAVMGFLWLGTVPLTNGLVSQIFGVRHLSTLFGLVFLGHQLGSFLGVWIGGWVFDHHRSYELVWWIALALGLLSAALHWPIDDRPVALRARLAAGQV
ncbi:MFS transporter [Piscinibacter defluvii]|uniref:MFS transporter n=1 Tax=Piscinibacter defluvii TaxID=1796922 RepID=UPI000FDF24FC|nr:MFS transporter [Piscinibacter defluvii]